MNLEAQCKDELVQKLIEIDISVLPRGQGRTNDQVERWVMYRAIATLLENNGIEYPISLLKRERPDYLLQSGIKKIGCEITEAINEDYLKAQSLTDASQNKFVVDVSLFKWDTPKRNLVELREIASRDKLTGFGWASNSVEREYAKIICDVAQAKTIKMAKTGYERFCENYLLIYCNQSLPVLDISEGAAFCFESLGNYWSPSSFDKILVEKGNNIAVYSKDKYQVLPLNDLWVRG